MSIISKADIKGFIKQCQQSSHESYEQFKLLLLELEAQDTRPRALQFLNALVAYVDEAQPSNCHFQLLRQNILDYKDRTVNLRLFQFPSTFLPEAWSFTFYEGLIRYPSTDYFQKQMVELGCGIGWITIALALRYAPQTIFGLDINPKAIVCAKLNLFLNAYDQHGNQMLVADGSALIDRVKFYESNLFSHFEGDDKVELDRIIGCIPQVLNPEPEAMEDLIAETSSDEYLHSLSNYFAKQGFIEDQFGLGLIASAVEQSIPILKSNGKLILNLGGRPGRNVLERLMQRRGFRVRRVWQTQVEQAADTEIDALVDIEKSVGHRFEFYMSANSDTPIDATTALEYAKAGGKIYHSVDVYEAEMLFPQQVKSIYSSVDKIGGNALRSAIDLTYDNFDDAEERYSFLAFLAEQLQKISYFPYQSTTGLDYFRQQLSEYFRYYLRVDIKESNLVVTPGRRELLDSLLINYQPSLVLVEKSLGQLLDQTSLASSAQLLHVPAKVEYILELVEKLKPKMVVTSINEYEIQSSHLIGQLVECCIRNNCLLIIDLTNNIDLSSQPEIHGVYRYLSNNGLPGNLVIMAALINNRVYQNYTLNFTLINNSLMVKNLADAAELTYSRTPFLKQLYYAHLLEELLYFQRTRATEIESVGAPGSGYLLTLSENASKAFSHPAIAGNHLGFDDDTVRLDYGENELPTPELLKEFLFESYLVRKYLPEEVSADDPLRRVLARRFKIPKNLYSKIVYGNGVAPIYAALLKLCIKEGKQIIIPSGSYGYFKAAAEYEKLSYIELKTQESALFKITPELLRECLARNPGSWLLLNAPIINPTGVIYNQSELSELIAIATEYDSTVIVDCIFSGLEFEADLSWDLSENIEAISRTKQSRLVLMGGLSKEFSAGGIRFGYSWSTSKRLLLALETEIPHSPHFTLGYAARKLISAQLTHDKELIQHLQHQRETLKKRARLLTEVLENNGWQVIPPQGGLFLVAKPQRLIEKQKLDLVTAGDTITQKLFEEKNLVINNSTWTGLPGYCRFVLSGNDSDFAESVKRLREFHLG
ncbi:aminotransferase class I/II-fold pyridoxal phosphate-dependent enzyme [Aliikangiella marina]|uniref:Aminotransferase class I/II-fold pyridoxal phosphate-dependent enzyme n=1 Tax=Aliikangiella marina TaxID=1712262 RepID=A0A545TBX3_9GAMM|nr:aminotransferase class I/II-fold pyridoxal phosphate-dependent enzyme [Aliikangiella marina]TQV74723.1 aminotransferase class I/II-fold pyridoxal phosphate-dependent enzyme [Aliikangiella marina]